MEPLPKIIRKHLSRIKIVHQLPGRLRLHVPIMEGLSAKWKPYRSDLVAIIKLKEGLTDIEISAVTGRVLIMYEPDLIDASQILQWFQTLAGTIYEAYVDDPIESNTQIVPFLKTLHSQLQQKLEHYDQTREIA